MFRTAVASGLVTLLAASVPAADKPLPEDIRAAVEEANVATIERASPSIVCILVSRSEAYKQFGPLPSAEWPGRLGAFDGEGLRKEADRKKDRTSWPSSIASIWPIAITSPSPSAVESSSTHPA